LEDIFEAQGDPDPYAHVPDKNYEPTYSRASDMKEKDSDSEDDTPLIIEDRVIVTETRIVRREAEAEGGSLKFVVVGLIVFIVATVGVVGLVIMTCNNDTVRMSVATGQQQEKGTAKGSARDSNVAL